MTAEQGSTVYDGRAGGMQGGVPCQMQTSGLLRMQSLKQSSS